MPAAVVDSSVAVKWVMREPGREEALRWLDRYESGQLSLIAPSLLLSEVASVLGNRHRRKQLTREEVRQAFQLFEVCCPILVEDRRYVPSALELSMAHWIALYDGLYLALAIERGCELITADKRFHAATASAYPFVRLLGDSVE